MKKHYDLSQVTLAELRELLSFLGDIIDSEETTVDGMNIAIALRLFIYDYVSEIIN